MLSIPTYSVCLCAGDIRLVGGSDPSEGRVELFYEGVWGRVLQPSTGHSVYIYESGYFIEYARAAVADVACRQTGYPYSEGLQSFGHGSGPAWLAISGCTGDEERVEQCRHLGVWRITYPSDPELGVRCRGKCSTRKTHTL